MNQYRDQPETIISQIIKELNGLIISGQTWTKKQQLFLKNRHLQNLSLLPQIKETDLGLEIGLCEGILALTLKRHFSLKKLYALEHPGFCHQFSRKYLKKISTEGICLKQGDLHTDKLPFSANFFDFMTLCEVCEHLIPAKIPTVLAEIRRTLKKKGWLLLTTPNITSLIKRAKLLIGQNPVKLDLGVYGKGTYGHIREYTMREMTTLLQKHGFKILEKSYFSNDQKRNFFLRLESLSGNLIPSFNNGLAILAQKI
ncbi:class I SAM-dependent methyltransferase [Patescibacteria group bacterium]